MGTPIDTISYTYNDADWGDLLTAYDGTAITRDEIGNPLNDGTWTYTWQNGRELASMTDGTTTWNYTYDANGMHTSRTNGTKTYNYVYNGSQLTQMTVGSDTLYFTYGILGPTTVTWNGTTYYYSLNGQGDVTGIFDEYGVLVVSYNWDNAWGYNPIPEGVMASTLGTLNPLQYRGYVYDTETGYYYLQSRYYDPEIGRFINADAFTTTGQGMLGNNMFAYCNNNPVASIDVFGALPLPIPMLRDFYYMHKQVQYAITELYGYAMEVRTFGKLGVGSLDIYDATHNQYYEVKSAGQAGTSATEWQMMKYDTSYIADWRFEGYSIESSPNRGNRIITGKCQYKYWDIYYSSDGNGLITYTWKLNEKRYNAHIKPFIAAVGTGIAAYAGYSSLGSYIGLGGYDKNLHLLAYCYR